MQRATADYNSLRGQAETHMNALESQLTQERHRAQSYNNQLQASHVQVQSLQSELQTAHAHIQSLTGQKDSQQEPGRLQLGQGLRVMTHSNSIPGTPRRGPGSPTGSSMSSSSRGSRGSRPTDFLVSLCWYRLQWFSVCCVLALNCCACLSKCCVRQWSACRHNADVDQDVTLLCQQCASHIPV